MIKNDNTNGCSYLHEMRIRIEGLPGRDGHKQRYELVGVLQIRAWGWLR